MAEFYLLKYSRLNSNGVMLYEYFSKAQNLEVKIYIYEPANNKYVIYENVWLFINLKHILNPPTSHAMREDVDFPQNFLSFKIINN